MDIRTKNTGKTFYQIDPTLGTILMELGMVDRTDKPPVIDPNPPGPRWGVTVNAGGNTCIVLTIGATTQWYDGLPEEAATGFQHKDWLGRVIGSETPKHICELYAQQINAQDRERFKFIHMGRNKK